jgi:uncharacterized repeat protein (TIGR03803 family)
MSRDGRIVRVCAQAVRRCEGDVLTMTRLNCSRTLVRVLAAAAALVLPQVATAQVPLATLHSFAASATDGGSPEGALIQGADGNIYGTTYQGGTFGAGTVFRMNAAGLMTVLHSFVGGSSDGAHPRAGLVQGTDGNFYGTTQRGGASELGTVFTMTPAGAVSLLHAFGGADGGAPNAALIEGSDGNFYGTTEIGGASNGGTVFRMTPTGSLVVLHAFGGNPDGSRPFTGLVQASDGNFYGTTFDGGAFNDGTVFRMTPAGAITVLHAFARGASDGGRSMGTLIEGRDGNLYGTTHNGGTSELGTVFRITRAGGFAVLHSFAGGSGDGAFPWTGIIEGSDGNFYGTTEQGGPFDTGGTVFRMTPAGDLTVLHAFARGTVDGASPITALIQAADGSFYGTALQGGRYTYGIAFRFEAVSCIDRLAVQYTGGTLDLEFTLQSTMPATWTNWVFYAGGSSRWAVPIPAVSPGVSFNVPLRGFPAIGPVAVFTALSTPEQGVMCWDVKAVNTGATRPAASWFQDGNIPGDAPGVRADP